MKQMILAYSFSKETVTAIMMFYKNKKSHQMVTFILLKLPLASRKEIISTISIYNLPRLHIMNGNSSNKRKKYHAEKAKKVISTMI